MRAHFLEARVRGAQAEKQRDDSFSAYAKKFPDFALEFTQRIRGELPPAGVRIARPGMSLWPLRFDAAGNLPLRRRTAHLPEQDHARIA